MIIHNWNIIQLTSRAEQAQEGAQQSGKRMYRCQVEGSDVVACWMHVPGQNMATRAGRILWAIDKVGLTQASACE